MLSQTGKALRDLIDHIEGWAPFTLWDTSPEQMRAAMEALAAEGDEEAVEELSEMDGGLDYLNEE